MTKNGWRTLLLAAFSLVLAAAAPLGVMALLRPDGPVVVVLAVLPGLVLLSQFRRHLPPLGGKIIGILLGIFYGISAFMLVIYIVVIPFTYYLAWLDLVRSGKPGGIISFLFYAVTAFFSAVFSGMIGRTGPLRPAAGMALVIMFEALVIYQTIELTAAFTVLSVIIIVLLALSTGKPAARRLVMPGTLLGLAAAFSLVFAVGSPPNSGVLVKANLLMNVKRVIVSIFPDLSALSSVAGYGYSFDRDDLGRKPVLSSVPLLKVDHAPSDARSPAVYLRTQIFDEYFNNNWGVSRAMLDRMNRERAQLTAAQTVPDRTISLSVLFDYVPLLPHTLDTMSVMLPGDSVVEVEAGNYDCGFSLLTPLVKGDQVALFLAALPETVESAQTREAADKALLLEESYNTRPQEAKEQEDEFFERYLQVPSTITGRIRDLAGRLSAGKDAPGQTAANIIQYLNQGYAYSLDTTLPPPGEEFTDDFLFVTRRGYCVHFATAFLMLARLNNIPARYATGFLAVRRAGQKDVVVTGYNAHAWPEMWVRELGWVTVEATPALNPANALIPDFYRFFNHDNDGLTARQLEAFMGEQIAAPRTPPPGPGDVLAAVLPVLPWAGLVVLLGVGVILGRRVLGRRRRRMHHYRGNLRRFNRDLCRLVARMERCGIRAPEKAGWMQWGEELKRRFPQDRTHIDALVRTVNGVFFGLRPAGERHIRYMRRFRQRLTAADKARSRTGTSVSTPLQ